jgi:ribokinase
MVPDLDRTIFAFATVVIANEIEMVALGTPDDLFAFGVKLVVVTLGKKGALLHESGKETVAVGTTQVEVVDTTGAGDSFLGSFAYCIAKGMGYQEAAAFACATATISVQSVGTQQSYAHRNDPRLSRLLL